MYDGIEVRNRTQKAMQCILHIGLHIPASTRKNHEVQLYSGIVPAENANLCHRGFAKSIYVEQIITACGHTATCCNDYVNKKDEENYARRLEPESGIFKVHTQQDNFP